MKNVFIVGAKSIGQYGGFETFVKELIENNKSKKINYYVTCKKNGEGYMNVNNIKNIKRIKENIYKYYNSKLFLININTKLGPAQAIQYDLLSLDIIIEYIQKNKINDFIIYILTCRIGPFYRKYVNKIHELNGRIYLNPDGHEWKRSKWSLPIRLYWKLSERLMIKYSDLIICDSKNIELYIKKEYKKYNPKTIFIPYGVDLKHSFNKTIVNKYNKWLKNNNINKDYYIVVARFVPENNFETIVKEFIKSKTDKDLVLITTKNQKLFDLINTKYDLCNDSRIKFINPIYDSELLSLIRKKAYAYIHGHSVGGTNPSLLEALSLTNINLLFDVSYNKEVAKNACLYWNLNEGSLSSLINNVDSFSKTKIINYSKKAKNRIKTCYTNSIIQKKYVELFTRVF